MPSEPRPRIAHLATQAARWRPSNRQIWLIVSALVVVACVEAIVVPARRDALAYAVAGLIGVGSWVTDRRRQRQERKARAARLAAVSPDGIPADIIDLVAAGQKIRAIKRYRQLTGVGLREAKVTIDSL